MKNLQKGFAISLIITIIALVVAGGGIYIYTNKSKVQQLADKTQEQADTASSKAKQASIKAFVANTMMDLGKYYLDEKNTVLFKQNPEAVRSVDTRLSLLNEKYPGEYSYTIFDGDDATVVKVRETVSNIYVCADSITIRVVDISAADYDKQTDCTGKPVK